MKSEDLYFLHHIKHNVEINLVDFIFQDMILLIAGESTALVHGMVINHIIDFYGVNTRVDPPIAHKVHNTIDEHTINKFA